MIYKGYNVDDNKVDEYVEKLDCSMYEACQLILEEQGKVAPTEETKKEVAETEKKAKGKRRYEQTDKPRKAVAKTRKVNENKRYILNKIIETFGTEISDIKVTSETAVDFKYNEKSYTLRLVEHREKKQ